MTMGVSGVVGLDAQIRNLQIGKTYLFEHRRKGCFVGVYTGFQATKGGDPEDALFLAVDVYTEEGSGQERLANSFIRDDLGRKMRPVYSSKLIRPSLLVSVTAPDEVAKRNLSAKFDAVRKQAEATAALHGEEVLYPSLSLPTAQAMDRLKEDRSKTGGTQPMHPLNNKVIGGALGAAGSAAAVAAYLLGVI